MTPAPGCCLAWPHAPSRKEGEGEGGHSGTQKMGASSSLIGGKLTFVKPVCEAGTHGSGAGLALAWVLRFRSVLPNGGQH